MRTLDELNEALLMLGDVNTPESRAQWEVIEGRHNEAWVFDKYVRNVADEDKNESLFYAARDAAMFVAGKVELEVLLTEEQEMPECPKPIVTDGVLAMLLHRIEKLETQVRILKGEKQKRSYKKASDYSKNDFLTQTEAFRYIGCSQCTIIKWTNKGMLKGYRKGQHLYYKKSELDNNPVVQNFKNINRI